FNIGTDPDIAQVQIQNRLQQVNSELPEEVIQYGLDVKIQNNNMLAMLVLQSPNHTYDELFLSNYAYTNLKNAFARIKGVGDVQIFGPQYSMRIWLDINKIAALGIEVDDVIITDELGGAQFRKPCDIAFRIMAARWKMNPADIAYVGDNPAKDFHAPKQLGMMGIQVNNNDGLYSGDQRTDPIKTSDLRDMLLELSGI
ncbi:MAG: efflux RND transporter permease subunit, partial [Clostridia bacterium]|nr:efflux RND transporter permease subunit [Clostridia bacterium]